MKKISVLDIFEIRKCADLSYDDGYFLAKFYGPFISFKGIGMFLALCSLKEHEIVSFETFFKMYTISPNEFSSELSLLEAVGLIKTYSRHIDSSSSYIFILNKIKKGRDFFSDRILSTLLKRNISNNLYLELKNKYLKEDKIEKEYQDESTSFKSYFTDNDLLMFNFNDFAFDKSNINKGFSLDRFLQACERVDPRITKNSFSSKELDDIASLSALFNYDEESLALLIFNNACYNFNANFGMRFNYDLANKYCQEYMKLPYLKINSKKEQVNKDSYLSRGVNKMDKMSPLEFLKMIQHNYQPAKADIELVNHLQNDMGLNPGVVNVLVKYVLDKNNNILSRNLCEKIAGSLQRENIQTSLDAIDYLIKQNNRLSSSEKTKSLNNIYENSLKTKNIKNSQSKSEEIVNDDYLALLDEKEPQ